MVTSKIFTELAKIAAGEAARTFVTTFLNGCEQVYKDRKAIAERTHDELEAKKKEGNSRLPADKKKRKNRKKSVPGNK